MKIMKTTLLVCALALVAGTADAAQGDMWFGIQGGVAVPTGDFGDVADLGFQGSLMGSYGVTKDFDLGIELGYHFWNAKEEYNDALVLLYGAGSEAKFNALQATAFGAYNFPMGDEKQKPYLKAGVGMYNLTAKLETPLGDDDTSESNFGFNVGAGYDYLVSPGYTLGINAAYHSIMTEDEATNLFTVGAKVAFGITK